MQGAQVRSLLREQRSHMPYPVVWPSAGRGRDSSPEAGGRRRGVRAWGFQAWKSSPGLSMLLSGAAAPDVVAKQQPPLSLQEMGMV